MKWFAVCSNGAVALGAFEAGVVAQLFADIAEVNASGQPKFGIDAIAGASAGAVTGLLLAQAIAAGSSPSELTNRLWKTWVEGLSADALLGDTSNIANSLFDPATLTSLSNTVLMDDDTMSQAGTQATAASVVLSIALTNVDGIPYTIQVAGPKVVASIYGDYETVVVQRGIPRAVDPVESLAAMPTLKATYSWDDVEKFAVTSAAFPFAFESQLLKRDLENYKNSIKPTTGTEVTFNYVDGGVLDNNPIGRAIDAATYADRLFGHGFGDHSIVVIEPDPATEVQAKVALDQLQSSLDPNGLPPLSMVGKLIGTYFNDALYKDLEQATAVNRQLAQLQELVDQGVMTAAQRQQVVDALEIGHWQQIEIARVVPAQGSPQLAGAFGGHFGGFLKQEYRAYDFGFGCQTARKWFDQLLPTALNSGLQKDAGARPNPDGFAGVGTAQLNQTKVKITNRVEELVKHDLKLKGIWGLVESGVLAAVHPLIRRELDDVLVDKT